MAAKKKGGMDTDTKVALEVGAGVLAAAAAAGATYWFYGADNAKKHRKAASKWAKEMKADVVKEAKKLKALDQKAMTAIVNKASEAYAGARSVDAADLKAAAAELKKNWRAIQNEISGGVTAAKKSATKAVKKATGSKAAPKKSAKKAPAKAKKTAKKRA